MCEPVLKRSEKERDRSGGKKTRKTMRANRKRECANNAERETYKYIASICSIL